MKPKPITYRSDLKPGLHMVMLDRDIIGVIRYDGNEGATIMRLKKHPARCHFGPQGPEKPYEVPANMRTLFPTISEASDAVIEHWSYEKSRFELAVAS